MSIPIYKKLTSIFIALCLVLGTESAISQDLLELSGQTYLGQYSKLKKQLDYETIKGNPYLDNMLMPGLVTFKNGDRVTYNMRYDTFSDEVEYLQGESLLVITNKENLDFITLNDYKIVYETYQINNQEISGYLLEVVSGQYNLYQKHEVEFIEAKPAISSYHPPTPDHFQNKGTRWLYGCTPDPITSFTPDKKSLKEIMRSSYPAVAAYIKENKLKLNRKADVIAIFEYYNSQL